MNKYYVNSGEHKIVFLASDPDDAVKKFFNNILSKDDCATFGLLTKVSEAGFSLKGKRHENDVFYDTEAMLKKIDGE